MREVIAKFINGVQSVTGRDFLDSGSSAGSRKLSFLDLSFMPLGILIYLYRPFFKIALIFAAVISILSLATGNSFGCIYIASLDNYPFGCTTSSPEYAAFFLLRLFMIAVFLRMWYQTALNGETVSWKQALAPKTRDWKTFLVLLAFVVINSLPIISFLLLVQRVPNPNWLIESLYFALVSSGLWLPFVALRFYSIIAFAAEGKKIPSLWTIFVRSSGNGLKIVLAIAFLMLFCVIFMANFGRLSYNMMEKGAVWGAVVAEFGYNLIFLMFSTIIFNFGLIQQNGLFFSADDTPKN